MPAMAVATTPPSTAASTFVIVKIADWAASRVGRADGAAKAWWQEVAGVLNAPSG